MERGVYEAHKAIIKEVAGGGTTLTAVLLMGGQLTISHVGDSRAYLMHQMDVCRFSPEITHW